MKGKALKRKCKTCGKRFETYFMNVRWCSPECGVKLAKVCLEKAKEKARLKRDKAEKARIKQVRERLKTRGDYLKELQRVFNQFIRLRDKDLPCISCGRFHSGKYDAGHYRSVGACPELRFHEDNCHKQCVPCNQHKSGNAIEYRLGLIARIGLARVEFLERKDHSPLKLSEQEIKDLIRVYKAKVKELSHG